MLPDRVSNPGPLTYESGVLPIALRGPAPFSGLALLAKKDLNNSDSDTKKNLLKTLIKIRWHEHTSAVPNRATFEYSYSFSSIRRKLTNRANSETGFFAALTLIT